jgi:hypothetical protein
MADFHVVVDALLVVIEELERGAHSIVHLQLAPVEGVDLGRKEGGIAFGEVVMAQAHQAEGLIHGPVEKHMVIGHVHVAVIVDPIGLDPHRRRDERGEENDRSPLLHDQCFPSMPDTEYNKHP